MQTQELWEEIEFLPIDMKTELVDRLLRSINRTDASIDAAWTEEIDRRKNELEAERVTPVDGEEVFRKIRRRLQRS
jgi:putative addiction module component (TIGR02574 family)